MEIIMNDKDSKDFLRDISGVHPEYKESCSAVSNLITLLMKELAKERVGRKRGEKFEKMSGELEKEIISCADAQGTAYSISISLKAIKQKYFPKDEDIGEICKLVAKIKEVMNKGLITAEELAKRLTPKD